MSSLQRVIKYCAMAFAIFLAVTIISGIASVVFGILHIIPGGTFDSGKWSEETVDYSKSFTDVKRLEINHEIGELNIKVGEDFKVEGVNVPERFEAEVSNNGKLKINYHTNVFHFPWFHINRSGKTNCKVTVYVPDGFVAEDVKLDTGAGNMTIEGLNTEDLEISAGAGNITGNNITAQKADIDGGVGNINLDDVNFADAVLECGVGNVNISGILTGKTKVDSGVGDVDLDLLGHKNDYGYNIDSGIGSVSVDGEKISGERKYNSDAANEIEVDGGIGNVRIDFNQE